LSQNRSHLIWIDLEMTGLDPKKDKIIEIATLITDKDLNLVAEGPNLAIYQPESVLEKMDDWNREHHKASGLWDRVLESDISYREAEQMTLDFLREQIPIHCSPMCGNTVCQDRRFLAKWMPELENYFHYRHIDVSTIKELAMRWKPELLDGLQKNSSHRALDDIRESIEELRHYRQFMGELSGLK
jgi:oligoribonuclease